MVDLAGVVASAGFVGGVFGHLEHRWVSRRDRQRIAISVQQELVWAVVGKPADAFNEARPGLLAVVGALADRLERHEKFHNDYLRGATDRRSQ